MRLDCQAMGMYWLLLPTKKIMQPPCDPPSVRLAKDASLYAIICNSFGLPKFWIWIGDFSFFAFFIVRLICLIHSTFSCFNIALSALTSKLRSGLVWVASQLSWPISCLALVISVGVSLSSSFLPFCSGIGLSFFLYSSCPILMLLSDFFYF